MKNEATEILQARVDKDDYKASQLISIKTPLNLPYYTNSEQFERVYGSVEIHGVLYEYVKRRVFNDSLELLCIPNHMKTSLQCAKNDIAKQSGELSGQQNKKSSIRIRIVFPEYYQQLQNIQVNPSAELLTICLPSTSEKVITRSIKCLEKPPEING
jgi:hypothetical protein